MQYQKYTSGHFKTRPSYGVSVLEDEDVIEVPFPTEYFCAPQFYYKDQQRFKVKPRQVQAALAGIMLIPIRMCLPSFNEQQKRYAAYLKKSYRVNNVYLLKNEVNKLKRQATAAVTDKKYKPSKDIFHENNRQTPFEAEQRLNSKIF